MMEETKMKWKPIFNMRLAGYLMQKGFVILDMEENDDGSGRKVFFFKDSIQINNAITTYMTDIYKKY